MEWLSQWTHACCKQTDTCINAPGSCILIAQHWFLVWLAVCHNVHHLPNMTSVQVKACLNISETNFTDTACLWSNFTSQGPVWTRHAMPCVPDTPHPCSKQTQLVTCKCWCSTFQHMENAEWHMQHMSMPCWQKCICTQLEESKGTVHAPHRWIFGKYSAFLVGCCGMTRANMLQAEAKDTGYTPMSQKCI